MIPVQVEYTARICRTGYRWDRNRLLPNSAKAPAIGPVDVPFALRQFIRCDDENREDFRAFADQFGLLGIGSETYARWRDECDCLRSVEQWDRGKEYRRALLNDIGSRAAGVRVGFTLAEREGRGSLILTAATLLEAMLLQCAIIAIVGPGMRLCGECGEPFEVKPGTGRRDKKYCGDKCRKRAERKRRA